MAFDSVIKYKLQIALHLLSDDVNVANYLISVWT